MYLAVQSVRVDVQHFRNSCRHGHVSTWSR